MQPIVSALIAGVTLGCSVFAQTKAPERAAAVKGHMIRWPRHVRCREVAGD